jgi:HAD superfamily phosphoserine phosphatase-like hydrolase
LAALGTAASRVNTNSAWILPKRRFVNITQERTRIAKHYLLASDFDQTLSFNDSGIILSELLGACGFHEKVSGLSRIHLAQQGAELAYLLLHDPEYRCVRKEHLVEAGKRIRLKQNIGLLSRLLEDLEDHHFSFYVISAAPEEVVQSALEGIVAPDHIYGTRFQYDPSSGEIRSIVRVPAGYGKVVVLEELRSKLQVGHDRVVYVGDGSSDIHVMLHVNRLDGLTIAVSENKYLTPIAKRTILSENALSVLVPILEEIANWDSSKIRALFESHGLVLQDWDKVRTDSVTIRETHAVTQVSVQ